MNRTQFFSSSHLSDEQLYGLLDRRKLDQPEEPSAHLQVAQAHLAACDQCRDEFAVIQSSLQSLKQTATGLAHAQFPIRLDVRTSLFQGMRRATLAWPLSFAAAAVLCGMTVSLVHRPTHIGQTDTGRIAVPATVQSQAFESDEALLDGISQDLSTSVAPSLQPLSISAEAAETSLTHN